MKKRQIQKNNKKVTEKITELASIVDYLDQLGVFSISIGRYKNSGCQMRASDLIKLPFAKEDNLEFLEFNKRFFEVSTTFNGVRFFSLVDDEERTKYFPGELDVKSYE